MPGQLPRRPPHRASGPLRHPAPCGGQAHPASPRSPPTCPLQLFPGLEAAPRAAGGAGDGVSILHGLRNFARVNFDGRDLDHASLSNSDIRQATFRGELGGWRGGWGGWSVRRLRPAGAAVAHSARPPACLPNPPLNPLPPSSCRRFPALRPTAERRRPRRRLLRGGLARRGRQRHWVGCGLQRPLYHLPRLQRGALPLCVTLVPALCGLGWGGLWRRRRAPSASGAGWPPRAHSLTARTAPRSRISSRPGQASLHRRVQRGRCGGRSGAARGWGGARTRRLWPHALGPASGRPAAAHRIIQHLQEK